MTVDETTELTTGFLAALAKGRSRAPALRDGQLALIQSLRRKHDGAANPFYWAAFTLTGHEPAQ